MQAVILHLFLTFWGVGCILKARKGCKIVEFTQWRGCHIAYCAPEGDPHAAAAALLSQLYRRVTGEALPPVCRTEMGKPYLENCPWHISVSHTPRHVFCCLATENVGIDAEECDRTAKAVYLSAAEQQKLTASDRPQQDFLRLWVLKEAYAKRIGKGVGNYLKATNFSPDDPRVTEIDGCFVAVITEKDDIHAI